LPGFSAIASRMSGCAGKNAPSPGSFFAYASSLISAGFLASARDVRIPGRESVPGLELLTLENQVKRKFSAYSTPSYSFVPIDGDFRFFRVGSRHILCDER
jgi:hypothetical protein